MHSARKVVEGIQGLQRAATQASGTHLAAAGYTVQCLLTREINDQVIALALNGKIFIAVTDNQFGSYVYRSCQC